MLSLTLIIVVLVEIVATYANEHMIDAPAGKINGYEYDSVLYSGKKAFQFLGIPYAEPPTGNLRFSKPKAKGKLDGTFNASDYGNSCIQPPDLLSKLFVPLIVPDEDCLTLNVFVPEIALQGAKKAVMVFIYGGGFMVGATTISGGEHLALFGDVIVVTMNYRVGALGFMDTGVDEAPGNVGLWDQQLALQWVNKNIESFGGSKDKVTIFGESAGAASVTYQMMFSDNNGLFQRVIAESGAFPTVWASTTAHGSQALSKELANKLKCHSQDPKTRLTCMRTIDAMTLLKTSLELVTLTKTFAPIRDDEFIKFEPKLCRNHMSECANHMLDVKYMSGINDFDGMLMAPLIGPTWTTDGITESVFQKKALPQMRLKLMFQLEEDFVNELVTYRYSDHTNSSDIARLYQFSDLYTDLYFAYPAFILSEISAALHRTSYVYRYGHKTFPDIRGSIIPGASHGDELNYVFGFPKLIFALINITLDSIPESEQNYSKAVMTYWTNFAKTGNPNEPEDEFRPTIWPEYMTTTKEFMDFGQTYTDIIHGDHLYADRIAFWADLLPELEKYPPEEKECAVSGVDVVASSLSVASLLLTILTLTYI